jgi:hypothetical protein
MKQIDIPGNAESIGLRTTGMLQASRALNPN